MSIVLKTPSNGSVTLAEQDTASNVTVTIPARTSNVMLDGPAFMANNSSTQSISAQTLTKATLNVESFDTANCYDTTTNRFTANVAGYYQINTTIYFQAGSNNIILRLYKNGDWYQELARLSTTQPSALSGSSLVFLNGTTDYIEMYVYSDLANTLGANEGRLAWWSGCLIRGA